VSPGHIVAIVAAVALAALVIWKRKRLGFEKTAVLLVVSAGLIVWASGLLSLLPNPEKVIEDIAQALGPWTYVLVGVMAFLETGAFVGLVAPGEFTVIIGGVVAGQGEISIVALIGLTWLCCILGDTASFFIGKRLGRAFLVKHGPKVRIDEKTLGKVESYFDRHGGKTVLIGRFIGLVRAVAPFVAGSSGMGYRQFLPFSIVGTGLWATTFSLLGFFFYRSFEKVANVAGQVTLVFGTLVAIIVGGVWAYRRLRDDEQRREFLAWLDKQGRRPLLRPVAAVVRPVWRRVIVPVSRFLAPQARFLWDRITPGGGLGIELTTALAVSAVGSYVFALTTVDVVDPGYKGPTRLDNRVTDMVDKVRNDIGVDVAEVVTVFGNASVVFALVAIAVVLLAWRRRPYELFVLLIGTVLVYAGVHITKAAVDRPRPAGSLVDTAGSAYPSGHAAYATIYVVLGIIAARVMPNLASKAALVTGTIVAAALIGASRVYLGAHYYSDVVAGWALGAFVFGTCAIVALVVFYVRQNDRETPPARPQREPATEHG
jgi:membrane protein DedA with SNARE-associated domain/membrane-associated phospholipid phosphatase